MNPTGKNITLFVVVWKPCLACSSSCHMLRIYKIKKKNHTVHCVPRSTLDLCPPGRWCRHTPPFLLLNTSKIPGHFIQNIHRKTLKGGEKRDWLKTPAHKEQYRGQSPWTSFCLIYHSIRAGCTQRLPSSEMIQNRQSSQKENIKIATPPRQTNTVENCAPPQTIPSEAWWEVYSPTFSRL